MKGVSFHRGLRGRVAALAALIALLATVASALLAAQALVGGLRSQREAATITVAEQARNRINRLVQRLASENAGYATWDDLYQRMPLPAETWARVNLSAGPARFGQVYVLVNDGVVVARYRRSAQVGAEPTRDDPAPAGEIAPLALPEAQAGLAVPGGFPVLFAAHPIRPEDGRGPARGTLVALSYLTSSLHPDLIQPGYELELAPIPRPALDTMLAWRDGRAAATVSVPTHDGRALAITAVETNLVQGDLVRRAIVAVIAGGVASAAIAILLGVAVGWSWMRPFTALADACRRRIDDETVPLPAVTGLHEAEVLRDALERLIAAERGHARRLGDALERQRTINAVHQRFLAQLGHEVGDPLHALVATMQRLAAEGGRLPPEEVAAAVERALELESRLQEALGLVGAEASSIRASAGERDVDAYLAGLAELLRSLAGSRGGTVAVSGSGRCLLRPELLTPVLINLAANALRAGRGVCVSIRGRPAAGGSTWEIEDDGPGIEPALAARIADACARGEVVPGSTGLGLGLAVVLANLRALSGRIVLENRPGQGVRFRIDLPDGAPGASQQT